MHLELGSLNHFIIPIFKKPRFTNQQSISYKMHPISQPASI